MALIASQLQDINGIVFTVQQATTQAWDSLNSGDFNDCPDIQAALRELIDWNNKFLVQLNLAVQE